MKIKEIIKLTPEARLSLEARARAGDVESVKDFIMSSAWQMIQRQKGLGTRQRLSTFQALHRVTEIVVLSS